MLLVLNYMNIFRKLEWIKSGKLKERIFKVLLDIFRGTIFILISAFHSGKMFHLFPIWNTLKHSISFHCIPPKLKVYLWILEYIFSGSEGEYTMTSCCISAWRLSIPETKHGWIRFICISASEQGHKELPQWKEKYQSIAETDVTANFKKSCEHLIIHLAASSLPVGLSQLTQFDF